MTPKEVIFRTEDDKFILAELETHNESPCYIEGLGFTEKLYFYEQKEFHHTIESLLHSISKDKNHDVNN